MRSETLRIRTGGTADRPRPHRRVRRIRARRGRRPAQRVRPARHRRASRSSRPARAATTTCWPRSTRCCPATTAGRTGTARRARPRPRAAGVHRAVDHRSGHRRTDAAGHLAVGLPRRHQHRQRRARGAAQLPAGLTRRRTSPESAKARISRAVWPAWLRCGVCPAPVDHVHHRPRQHGRGVLRLPRRQHPVLASPQDQDRDARVDLGELAALGVRVEREAVLHAGAELRSRLLACAADRRSPSARRCAPGCPGPTRPSTRDAMRSIVRDVRGPYSERSSRVPNRVPMSGMSGLSSAPKPPGATRTRPRAALRVRRAR